MKTTRTLAAVLGAAALVGGAVAPATAAPASTVWCTSYVIDGTGGGACSAWPGPGARFTQVLEVHDRRGYQGGSMLVRLQGAGCTREFDGRPDAVVPLGLLAGRGASVTKVTAGHCTWQLEDAQGRRTVWVEGSRTDLSGLGDGWADRAVRLRLD